MSRRSAPPLRHTSECGEHRPYRTEDEATYVASWHPVGACDKCRRGRIWHVWKHNRHWHVGHGRPEAAP